MSKTLDDNAVGRAVRGVLIGAVRRQNTRKLQRELEGLMERDQQFQIDISGHAEEFPSWSQVHLDFDVDFVDATGQRDSDFDKPLFTYGVEIVQGGPVGIMACVLRWDLSDRREVTGCMLALGPVASDHARTFRGRVHVNFQGYGAPAEAYGDPESFDSQ